MRERKPNNPDKWTLNVNDALCLSKEVYGAPASEIWHTHRFQQWHDHGVAVISGTTFANDQEHGTEAALDAAAARKYFGTDGVLNQTVLMTLDALGHGRSEEENKLISSDNKHLVSAIDDNLSQEDPVDLQSILTNAGKAVFTRRNKENNREIDENGSATAIAVVEKNEETEQMQCHLANFGDTMAVVLQGDTLAIKTILPARAYIQSEYKTTFTAPTPMHLIEHNQDALLYETVSVAPGDVIILMSDGIFDELDHTKTESEIKHESKEQGNNKLRKTKTAIGYQETRLSEAALELALKPLTQHPTTADEYDIATAIVEHIKKKVIAKRSQENEFHQWVQDHAQHIQEHVKELSHPDAGNDRIRNENKSTYTMQQWFSWKENHSETTADQAYSFSQFQQDLTKYLPFINALSPDEINIPVKDRNAMHLIGIIYAQKSPRSGDCATISVMRVPDPDVELIRAWIDFPAKHKQLSPKLINTISKKYSNDHEFQVMNWMDNSLAKIASEKYISPGSRGDATRLSAYQPEQLKEIKQSIEIQSIIKKASYKALVNRINSQQDSLTVTQRNDIYNV